MAALNTLESAMRVSSGGLNSADLVVLSANVDANRNTISGTDQAVEAIRKNLGALSKNKKMAAMLSQMEEVPQFWKSTTGNAPPS
jgi:hypothetical protein